MAKLLEFSQVMADLTYPAKVHKLELTRNEIQDLTLSKLRAILDGNDPVDEALKALEEVTKSLALTNTGDKNLDQRYKTAISHHLESGTIPDQLTSPQRAASEREGYVKDQAEAYHEEQDRLFRLLKGYTTAFNDLEVNKGILKRAGTELTFVQLSNTVDKTTKTFLLNTDIQEGSITSGKLDREKISELCDSCMIVAAGRIAVSFTFDDNILNVNSYTKWVKHVTLIASFVALAVALKKLVSY